MEKKLAQFVDIIQRDPAVKNVNAFTGGSQTNSGFVFVVLKPLSERQVSMEKVISRLRPKLNQVAGARLFLQERRTSGSAGARATPNTSTPCWPTTPPSFTSGRPSSKRHCKRCRC